MSFVPQSRHAMLRRIAQLESELALVRRALKDLGTRDPATAEVVMRGARLARERSTLENWLERLRVGRDQSNEFQPN